MTGRPTWIPTDSVCEEAREMASNRLAAGQIGNCLGISKSTFDNGSGFIFPSPQAGKPISDTTINKLLSLSPKHITTHGFRGTFKTWAEETTYGYSNYVIEACQAHKVGNKIEQHYFKGDFMEKRRTLMHEWGQFVESAL